MEIDTNSPTVKTYLKVLVLCWRQYKRTRRHIPKHRNQIQLRENSGTVRATTLTGSYLILTNTVPMLNLTCVYDPLQNKGPTYFKVTK
jgi:hypothetical protein